MLSNKRVFQKVASGILIVFMGLMVVVTIVAHTRRSGSTRQDMAQAQLLRKEAEGRTQKIQGQQSEVATQQVSPLISR